MDQEEQVILKLTCATCDNPNCKVGPKYAPAESLMGCTRRVPESIYEQYIHYMKEVIILIIISKLIIIKEYHLIIKK